MSYAKFKDHIGSSTTAMGSLVISRPEVGGGTSNVSRSTSSRDTVAIVGGDCKAGIGQVRRVIHIDARQIPEDGRAR